MGKKSPRKRMKIHTNQINVGVQHEEEEECNVYIHVPTELSILHAAVGGWVAHEPARRIEMVHRPRTYFSTCPAMFGSTWGRELCLCTVRKLVGHQCSNSARACVCVC